MPDVLDAASQAMIRDVVGAVNANTVEIRLTHEGLPGSEVVRFSPGALFCYDITWVSGESIHGSCWYDPDGFDQDIRFPASVVDPIRVRKWRAHFPDYVIWRVEHAPRDRNSQTRMFRTPDATLPICPDALESTISPRAQNE